MTINIPENTFSHPEPREDVVQHICNALLAGARFETSRIDCCVRKFVRVDAEREFDLHFGLQDKVFVENHEDEKFVQFHESEMNAAFDALVKAGYHIFYAVTNSHGSISYVCRKEDYCDSEYTECDSLHPWSHWD